MKYSKERQRDKRFTYRSDRELIWMTLRRCLTATTAIAVLCVIIGCTGDNTSEHTPKEASRSTAAEPGLTMPADPTNAGTPDQGTANPGITEAGAPTTTQSGLPKPENGTYKNNISVASPQTEIIVPNKAEEPISYDATIDYAPERPSLMGLSIGTHAAVVTNRYGEPTSSYALPDDPEHVTVHQYPGFSVGIQGQKVLFVEVSASSVNPGLNGLRLGDTLEAAIEKLGTPTSNTDFVMNYVSSGSLLKLDLNPATKTILSIKLFPEE